MDLSIELCRTSSREAIGLIAQKIEDTTLPLYVGGRALKHIVDVAHHHDSKPIITYRTDSDEEPYPTFQFDLMAANFADTAVDQFGQLICHDCGNC